MSIIESVSTVLFIAAGLVCISALVTSIVGLVVAILGPNGSLTERAVLFAGSFALAVGGLWVLTNLSQWWPAPLPTDLL